MDCPLSADTKAIKIANLCVKSFNDSSSLHGNELRNFRTTETSHTQAYFGTTGFKLYTPFINCTTIGCFPIGKPPIGGIVVDKVER